MQSLAASDVRIREATDRDAAALARLAEETFRETFAASNPAENMRLHCEASYSESLQLAEIRSPQMETWLADDGHRLVAYAQLRRAAAPPAVGALRPVEIQRFYVRAHAHGQGVARALMEHVLARAGQLAADVVWLGVWEHNPRAIAFYRKWGFEAVGEHVFMLGDDPQRDLLMRRVTRPERPLRQSGTATPREACSNRHNYSGAKQSMGNAGGRATFSAAMAAARDCADTMEAQAANLVGAVADVPMDASLRAQTVEHCATLKDRAGRVTFELALLEAELGKGGPPGADTVRRLVGVEATMMEALAPLAELADALESAAERDPAQERAFVLVIEATGVMLQSLDHAREATAALGGAAPRD